MVRVRQSPGQADLDFSGAVPDPEPAATPADVDRLVAMLAACAKEAQTTLGADGKPHCGWFTAADLAKRLGEGWSDRKVRRVASAAAPGVVSFPGAKGYKLWAVCSVPEIQHCIRSFERQAREMTLRAALYERAFHEGFRG